MISFFRFLGIRCQFGCFDFSCFLMIRLISFSFIKPLFWYQAVFADLCTIIEAFCILTNCINSFTWYFFQHPYEEGYKFYLNYLEQTENINYLDTVAQVYNDNGNKRKALEIYEKRILPWVALEKEKTKAEFRGYYDEIKNGKIKVPFVSNSPNSGKKKLK
ncbi:MAG: hypothetical protein D3903_17915 [Candidatus Electrothrix sp. GM3_4]|nr:hypothetical protein [Candidatus Electrothrix sp. GM3_4]